MFTEQASDGVTNGATPVEMVAAPILDRRRIVRTLTVFNADTVAANVSLVYVSGGNRRRLKKQTGLAAGADLTFEGVIVLDADDKSIEVELDGAVTTNELEWTASYAEVR